MKKISNAERKNFEQRDNRRKSRYQLTFIKVKKEKKNNKSQMRSHYFSTFLEILCIFS
jgi:hypothetical protein